MSRARNEAVRLDFLRFLEGIEPPANVRVGSRLFGSGLTMTYDVVDRESAAVYRLASLMALSRAQRTAPPDLTFANDLRTHWPGRFACEMSCDPGWHDLLAGMSTMIDEDDPGGRVEFRQVKEKFGTLRAYRDASSPHDARAVGECVRAAETLSERVCERCGAPGRLRVREGYWFTSCDMHDREGSKLASTTRMRTP